MNADVGRFLRKCGVAITGAVTSFAEAKIVAAVADYGAVATAVVSEAVVDYVVDGFLLPSGSQSRSSESGSSFCWVRGKIDSVRRSQDC